MLNNAFSGKNMRQRHGSRVAQIFNLLYRRIAFGQACLQHDAQRITNPRYGRMQFCATTVAAPPRWLAGTARSVLQPDSRACNWSAPRSSGRTADASVPLARSRTEMLCKPGSFGEGAGNEPNDGPGQPSPAGLFPMHPLSTPYMLPYVLAIAPEVDPINLGSNSQY